MKRRQLLEMAGGFAVTAGLASFPSWGRASAQTPASSGTLAIRALGHSCFLFSGDNQRVLVNPFRQIGCTQGYPAPQVEADLVLLSSLLFDEGFVEGLPGQPRILFEPGVYELGEQQIQGIRTDHDRKQGRRFGRNVVWRWQQGNITLLHLGGAAAPISLEQKILMGTPDVLFVPVSGGPKAYTPAEARQAISVLSPKIIIPTQYRTEAADPAACPNETLDAFLREMEGTPVTQVGSQLAISPTGLPTDGPEIRLMSV